MTRGRWIDGRLARGLAYCVFWGTAFAIAVYVLRGNLERLEHKVNYQRQLINGLRDEVQDMHGEWRVSVEAIRNDIRGENDGDVRVNQIQGFPAAEHQP